MIEELRERGLKVPDLQFTVVPVPHSGCRARLHPATAHELTSFSAHAAALPIPTAACPTAAPDAVDGATAVAWPGAEGAGAGAEGGCGVRPGMLPCPSGRGNSYSSEGAEKGRTCVNAGGQQSCVVLCCVLC